MITVRPGPERGATRIGWLDSRHSFSFGDYQDPAHMGFRSLRVINDDRVAPAAGFGKHGHRDMEILTYVLNGSLEHQDSLGTKSIIRPNELQRMSAGTGILHSEYNPSQTDEVHFLQIWLLPQRGGLKPGYEQRAFPESERRGQLRLVAAPDGREGALTIHQDAEVFLGLLESGREVVHELRSGRHAWLQVLKGGLKLNEVALSAGDGAAVTTDTNLVLQGLSPAEVMLFDLA
jgi:redox-sensitive bicupin YhaK (pirin superfamily)